MAEKETTQKLYLDKMVKQVVKDVKKDKSITEEMEYILWMRGLKYVVLGDCESNLIQTITLGTYESVHLPETKDHVVTE